MDALALVARQRCTARVIFGQGKTQRRFLPRLGLAMAALLARAMARYDFERAQAIALLLLGGAAAALVLAARAAAVSAPAEGGKPYAAS